LLTLLLSFALEYSTRKEQESQEGMAVDEAHQLLICTDKVNGCETWSPTLREHHRLMVFENRMLRRIYGFKSEEVTGD